MKILNTTSKRYIGIAVCAFFASHAFGQTTHLVKADGTGDFPTLQAAVDGAAENDIIELADGTFQGPGNWFVEIDKDLIFRSQSGNKENCIIDPNVQEFGDIHADGLSNRRPVFVLYDGVTRNSIYENMTIKNAGSFVNCPECVGGAFLVFGGSPLVRNLTIIDGKAKGGSGVGIEALTEVDILFERCTFVNCLSGTINIQGGMAPHAATFDHCLFYKGAVLAETISGTLNLINCTVADYDQSESDWWSLMWDPVGMEMVNIENTLITRANLDVYDEAYPNWDYTDFLNISYSNFYNNELNNTSNPLAGNWTGAASIYQNIQGNFENDPLFVNAGAHDYHLTASSPCVDAGNPLSPLDPDGTIADVGCFFFNQSGVGIQEVSEAAPFQIYPNPASDYFTLLNKEKSATITLYDAQGRIVQQHVSNSTYEKFSVLELNSGVYIIDVNIEDKSYTTRLQVTH